MNKTFITEQDQWHMKSYLDKSADLNTKLRNILRVQSTRLSICSSASTSTELTSTVMMTSLK